MNTALTSPNYLELVTEDAVEIFHLCRQFDINAAGVCKVSVNFVREGLTDEICYENFTRRARALLAAEADQISLLD